MSRILKKIVVVLTTYNAEDVIQRTIDSILNQKGKGKEFDLELLVIDDCSKDNTRSILESYGIRVLSTLKNSGGPNKGRNMGLKLAEGDYICIADQDDEWHSDRLSTQLKYANLAPIISSGYTLYDHTTGKSLERYRHSEKDFLLFEENATFRTQMYRSKRGQNSYLGGLMYSSMLRNVLFEEEYGMVDYDWYLRLFHKQTSVEVCRSLYTRHIDGNNLSLDENYRQKDFDYALKTLDAFRDQYPGETKLARKRLHGSRGRYFYSIERMKDARKHFLKSGMSIKILMYYLTTFAGYRLINKFIKVFG